MSNMAFSDRALNNVLVQIPAKTPPDSERVIEPYFDDPFPDYDTVPVMAYANDPHFAA